MISATQAMGYIDVLINALIDICTKHLPKEQAAIIIDATADRYAAIFNDSPAESNRQVTASQPVTTKQS
jgi:hypothetical protein